MPGKPRGTPVASNIVRKAANRLSDPGVKRPVDFGEPGPDAVPFMLASSRRQCQWLHGDGMHSLACGAPVVPGQPYPYCEAHLTRCIVVRAA